MVTQRREKGLSARRRRRRRLCAGQKVPPWGARGQGDGPGVTVGAAQYQGAAQPPPRGRVLFTQPPRPALTGYAGLGSEMLYTVGDSE